LDTDGIRRVRFHVLGHTAAPLMLAKPVDPKVVSEVPGHATATITRELYSQVFPDMQHDAPPLMAQSSMTETLCAAVEHSAGSVTLQLVHLTATRREVPACGFWHASHPICLSMVNPKCEIGTVRQAFPRNISS
jgi:hypothetical protein